MKRFGTILREARTICGLKGYELAKKVGVNPVYITQIEKHDKLPSPLVMKKITDVLKDRTLFETYLKIKYPILHEIFQKEENDLNGECHELGLELTDPKISQEKREGAKKRVNQLITRTYAAIDRHKKILVMLENIEKKHYIDPRIPSEEK